MTENVDHSWSCQRVAPRLSVASSDPFGAVVLNESVGPPRLLGSFLSNGYTGSGTLRKSLSSTFGALTATSEVMSSQRDQMTTRNSRRSSVCNATCEHPEWPSVLRWFSDYSLQPYERASWSTGLWPAAILKQLGQHCAEEAILMGAAACGFKELEWLLKGEVDLLPFLGRVLEAAGRGSKLDVLGWAARTFPGPFLEHAEEALQGAAVANQLDVFDWFVARRIHCSSSGAAIAAAGAGHLDVLNWLEGHGSFDFHECGEVALLACLGNGQVHVLEWFRKRGLEVEVSPDGKIRVDMEQFLLNEYNAQKSCCRWLPCCRRRS